MKSKQATAVFFAVLAAALYALSSPLSKKLLEKLSAPMMAALLYIGAGAGMLIVWLIRKKAGNAAAEPSLTRAELPYTAGMVVLDIAAPVFLMLGLSMTTAANAALLNNFEIVATSLLALFLFKEVISKRLWLAIALVTVSSVILSFEDIGSLSFSYGSLFVLAACLCWGFENNCTRMLSSKNPVEIVVVKGFGSGTGSLIIALLTGTGVADAGYLLAALLLGFVAYGLSILFYIYAQRELGAAKTSAYYALAPFIGAALSLLLFRQLPSASYLTALGIMMLGAYFASTEAKPKRPGTHGGKSK